uniref:Uncharacterized protein n=1 Tax=Mastacembelus armatus TaxID=205130 RepID=A0A7N8YF70_9TELE
LKAASSALKNTLDHISLLGTPVSDPVGLSGTPVSDPVGLSGTPVSDPVGLSGTPVSDPVCLSGTPVSDPVCLSGTPVSDPVGLSGTPVSDPVGLSGTPVSDPVGLSETPVSDPVCLSGTPVSDPVGLSETPVSDPVCLSGTPVGPSRFSRFQFKYSVHVCRSSCESKCGACAPQLPCCLLRNRWCVEGSDLCRKSVLRVHSRTKSGFLGMENRGKVFCLHRKILVLMLTVPCGCNLHFSPVFILTVYCVVIFFIHLVICCSCWRLVEFKHSARTFLFL